MKAKLALLLLGILLGFGLAQLAPRFWDRVAPQALRGAPTVGTVESKGWEDDRLLLTLITDGGAVLATFHERTGEIDLLVDVGDTVELGLARYRPFVEDPRIDRVVKGGRSGVEATTPEEPAATPPAAEMPTDDPAPDEDPTAATEAEAAPAGAGAGDEPGDAPSGDPSSGDPSSGEPPAG